MTNEGGVPSLQMKNKDYKGNSERIKFEVALNLTQVLKENTNF